jgi:lysophospholipase L1-like esterase
MMVSESTQPGDDLADRPALSVGKKFAFSAAVLVGGLALAEGVCRLLPASRPPQIQDYIEPWENWHAEEKAEMRTISDDLWVLQGPGTNVDGFRDRFHMVAGRPGTVRIACLGDSVTYGYEVGRESSYPSALERALQGKGIRAEIFNVAVPGWSIRQETLAYKKFVSKYKVDYVILGVCLNDIPEMQNNVAPSSGPAVLVWLARNSALVRVVFSAHAREIGDVRELFTDPDSARVQNAWDLMTEGMLGLHAAVERDGGRLIVAVLPFRFQLEADAPEPIPQRRIVEFCRQHEIPCIDLLEPLRRTGKSAFIDYDHLSPIGAEAVAEHLVSSGVLGT